MSKSSVFRLLTRETHNFMGVIQVFLAPVMIVLESFQDKTMLTQKSPVLIFGTFLFSGVVASLLCLWLAAAGDGTYLPATLLFPYTMFSTSVYAVITRPFIILALVQFPLYGIILAFAQYKRRLKLAGIILSGIHFSAVLASFAFTSRHFW